MHPAGGADGDVGATDGGGEGGDTVFSWLLSDFGCGPVHAAAETHASATSIRAPDIEAIIEAVIEAVIAGHPPVASPLTVALVAAVVRPPWPWRSVRPNERRNRFSDSPAPSIATSSS